MSVRGVYVVRFSGAITVAKTLIQIKAGATNPLELLRARISNITADVTDGRETLGVRLQIVTPPDGADAPCRNTHSTRLQTLGNTRRSIPRALKGEFDNRLLRGHIHAVLR